MVAEKCGVQSTLLTAIDKDSGAGYVYAVRHATGPSTVIKSLGKVPVAFKDVDLFRYAWSGNGPLAGE